MALLVLLFALAAGDASRSWRMPSTRAVAPSRSHGRCHLHKDWALHVHEHQARVSSQYGQDGALAYVFDMVGVTNRFAVEYGFNSDSWEGGSGANTYELHSQGWSVLLLDGAHANATINLHRAWLSADTIVATLEEHGVPLEPDLLCNDIDSADLWILRAVLGRFRPRVVLVEFNVNYPLESTLTNHPNTSWEGNIYGASLRALAMVADELGYAILDVIGHDLLLLRRDLLCGSDFPPLERWRPFTRRRFHPPFAGAHSALGEKLVDYAIWRATEGNMSAAQGAAVMTQVDAMSIFSRYDGQAT